MSETTSAMSKLRKVDDLKGRHKLAEPGLDGCADAIYLEFHVISIFRADQRSHIPTSGGRVMVVVAGLSLKSNSTETAFTGMSQLSKTLIGRLGGLAEEPFVAITVL